MSSRHTSTNTMSTKQSSAFSAQFKNFAPKAWTRYNGGKVTSWSREEARNFWHRVNNEVPFTLVYTCLLQFATIMTNIEEASHREEVEEDLPSSVMRHDTQLVNAIVPEGELTDAEKKFAQSELNRTLFREYTIWYDSFVAEAEEDSDNSLSAKDRFSLHCAKVLYRRTGLCKNLLKHVVSGWLERHLESY